MGPLWDLLRELVGGWEPPGVSRWFLIRHRQAPGQASSGIICSGLAFWLWSVHYASSVFKRQLTWAGDKLIYNINSLEPSILFHFI